MVKTGDVKFGDKSNCLPEGFWSAVDVWIKKPHVVNKRLCGATQTEDRDVDIAELKELLPELTQCTSDELNEVVLFLSNSSDQNDHSTDTQWSLTIRTIIPKVNTYGRNVHKEVILRGLTGQKVTFLPIEQDKDGQHSLRKSNVYQIQLNGLTDEVWTMSLHTLHPEAWVCDGVAYPKLAWLGGELLAKLARWATDSHSSEFKSTLSLIPIEKYSLRYQQLKDKYKNMVKVWPEVTDPEKFVYEDVAIATYLLVLWEEERAEKGLIDRQSFVDLGCGNGLLVHILTNEGHPGKGIDVRKRNIWDMYGPQTHLEESAISPGEGCLFPNADWLIGNHSDELTPWIPLIAARSSSSCRFFLLPCCFFDFYGKHQRRRCGASQYREYIDYISHICTQCGFETQEDCLRIPSTKRVCLIGRGRSYSASEEATVEEQRRELLSLSRQRHQHHPASSSSSNGTRLQGDTDRQQQDGEAEEEGGCGRHDNPSDGDGWGGGGFRPRERVEVVRNCATLPREFVDGVVLRVARTLLGLTCRGQQEQQEEEENGQNGKKEKDGEEEEEEEVVKKKKKKKNGEEDLIKSRGQRQQQEDKNGGNEVKEKKMDGEEVKKGEEEEKGRNREGRLQQQDEREEMEVEKDGQKEENKKKEEEEDDDEEEAKRKAWNSGGSLSIREVAELLDASELQRLKSECGGLQTLLRNNHQVFRVEGGRVYIRDWRAAVLSRGGARRGGARRGRGGASMGTGGDATKRKPLASPPDGAVKTRLCWFHAHHPHGCPLPGPQCPFAHGPDELRPSTRPIKKPRH